jgi:tripeptidyl-peptidase-1
MRSLIALVVCASAALHKEGNYSSQWLKVAAPFAAPVRFTISVKQQNMDLLKRTALEISTPDSPAYGQFMTDAEIDAMTAPTGADMNSVTTWLEKAGISHTVERSNVHCTTNVATASAMFATKFYKVSPELQIPGILADKHFLIRAGTFTIPDNIQSSISTIFGLHGLPLPKRMPLIPSAATDIVTPAVIEQDYGIKDVKVSRKTKFRQAVAEFQGQYMNATDLSTFFRELVPSARAGDDKVFKYVGASKHDGAGVEALLDIQYIMGVAPGVKTEFWEYPGQDFCLDLNTYTTDMITGDDKPVVHSISYGWQGDLSDLHCTQTNIDVVDGNFAKAAAKGISVMISSGDSGSGYSPQNCGPSGEEKGIAITGRLIGTLPNFSKDQCCSGAYKTHATGWTWTNANQGTCKLYQKVTAHGKSCSPIASSRRIPILRSE